MEYFQAAIEPANRAGMTELLQKARLKID